MKKITFFISLILIIGLMPLTALAAEAPDIQAVSALLVETQTGDVLYGKNMADRAPPDELAKIMTVLLGVEYLESGAIKADDKVLASASSLEGIKTGGRTAIEAGERVLYIDLLYCAYLGAYDEACNMIAESVAGGIPAFVERMNDRAVSIGCTDTHYVNVTGAKADGQYTSAYDQFLILREAMRHSIFARISGTFQYEFDSASFVTHRRLTSGNSLLNTKSKYYYSSCTGGKYGFSSENRYQLASSAKKGELTLIAIVLGARDITLEDQSTQLNNLHESIRLYEWGFNSFSWQDIVSEHELVTKTPVAFGAGEDYVNVRPAKSVTMLLPNGFSADDFTRQIRIYHDVRGEELNAPVNEGDILGEMTLYYKGQARETITLVANTGVELQRIRYIEAQIKNALTSGYAKIIMAVLSVMLAGYIALLIRYHHYRRKKRKQVEEAKRRLMEDRRRIHK